MNFLILHGWQGSSGEHWFKTFGKKLKAKGFKGNVPDLPHADFPKQNEWLKVIDGYRPDKDWLLIGHSLGGTAILRYLESSKRKINQAILIASPTTTVGIKAIKDFFKTDFDWGKIKSEAKRIDVINSNDDPYVSVEMGKDLAKNLDAKFHLIKNHQHFHKIDLDYLEGLVK